MKNEVVWITGASSGIGRSLCEKYATKNWIVILSSRNKIKLEDVRRKLKKNNHRIIKLDLSQTKSHEDIVKQAWNLFNKIDLLIHCGGISQRGFAIETKLEVERKIMEIDFFGTISLSKYILPRMIEQKKGHIAVVTSIVGKIGSPYRTTYSAAKHALHGYFDSLRLEVEPFNIKITLILPGFVRTEVSKNSLNSDGSFYNKLDKNQKKGITPEKCANQIYKGIKQKKDEFLVGGKELLIVYIRKFFPKLFKFIMKKSFSK